MSLLLPPLRFHHRIWKMLAWTTISFLTGQCRRIVQKQGKFWRTKSALSISPVVRVLQAKSTWIVTKELEIRWLFPSKEHGSGLPLKSGCYQLSLIKRFIPLLGKKYEIFLLCPLQAGCGGCRSYIILIWLFQLSKWCLFLISLM